jgi:hypothetical protein
MLGQYSDKFLYSLRCIMARVMWIVQFIPKSQSVSKHSVFHCSKYYRK